MRYQLIAILLMASVCGAQTPIPVSSGAPNSVPQAPSMPQAPTTPAAPAGSITVAQGTSIPLTLVSSIMSKSTHPGDTVRAVVAFPVTVGTQLAIPAGTYVEGMVTAVTTRAPHTHMPSVQIHFTRLLFANGYSAALDAVNTEAILILPEPGRQAPYEIADAREGAPFLGEGFGAPGQTTEPPPLPRLGPNPGVIVGATLGGTAALLVLLLTLGRHNGNTDFVIFDNGWQFQITLQSPLTLDTAKVAAAANTPAAH
jgi:hypothetical protein